MISYQELQDAVETCLNEKDPNANTCIKLAAYYTIMDRMKPEQEGYSGSDSEFMAAVMRVGINNAMPIINDMMERLQAVNPRLYDWTIQRLKDRA